MRASRSNILLYMSTFFEKLTGSRRETGEEDDTVDNEPIAPPIRPIKKYSLPKNEREPMRHMRVAEENDPLSPPRTHEEDEEGELTVDIYDKDDAIVIQSTVAGVKPEDIDISVTNDTVTLKGKRERFDAIEEKDYYYKELFWGAFSRSVILPEEVDEELAEAALKHGLLTIKLPKRRRGVVQKVKVKTI